MAHDLDALMDVALEEARKSLREGNKGFGAVVARNGNVVCSTHDTEVADSDPTSHAELKAISVASRLLKRDFGECTLVSTHEPCPMCATAVVWSGIPAIAYGYSIADALAQGRNRIDLPCREVFDRAGASVQITEGVRHAECSVLYREDVRREVKRLRAAWPDGLKRLEQEMLDKRAAWLKQVAGTLVDPDNGDALQAAYTLILRKLGLCASDAPVVSRTNESLVFHSQNFCPTLEACLILGLDTRVVCKQMSERPTDLLVKAVSPSLSFRRNYDRLRPHADVCEEMVVVDEAVVSWAPMIQQCG